jgi:hypothetical protein
MKHGNLLIAACAMLFFTTRAFAQDTTMEWYRYITVNGLVSGSTTYNFNHPSDERNHLRVFDVDANSLNLDLLALTLHHDPTIGEVGFRADFAAGPYIPNVIHSAGLEMGDFDVDQAYLSYVAPIGNGLRFDGGKFITPLGYEYIERFDGQNDNASHSYLFGYAIPFTHTGLRLTYSFSDDFSVLALLVNGWDNSVDNNKAKSEGLQVTWTPSSAVNVAVGAISGPEKQNNISDNRLVLDLAASFKLGRVFTLGVNGDYGREDNDLLGYTTVVIDSMAPVDSQIVRQQYKEQVPAYGAAVWKGIAVYLRFTVSDALAFIVRGDLNGVRTGTSQSLREVTLTPEWKPTEHLTLRGDLRFDHSSALVFNLGGNVWGSQSTASVNALYSF